MFTFEDIDEIVLSELNALLRTTAKPDPLGGDAEGYWMDDYEPEDAADELSEELFNELSCMLDDDGLLPGDTNQPFRDAVDVYAKQYGEAWLFHFGSDVMLTRNRHGAGFWDRGLPSDAGDVLTDWAHMLGSKDTVIPGEDCTDMSGDPINDWAGMFYAE